MKGLLDIIFYREPEDPHFICCYSLKLLLKLLDRSLVRQADYFLKLFVGLPADKIFREYNLRCHLEVKGLRKCKVYSYELLYIYRLYNPTNQTHLTSIFTSNKDMENYIAWEKSQIITSIIGEHIRVDHNSSAFSGQRKESDNSIVMEEPAIRTRSMTVFQLSPSLKRANQVSRAWPLSLEGLSRLYQSIVSIDFEQQDVNSKTYQTIAQRFARHKRILRKQNQTMMIDKSKGTSFFRLDFPDGAGPQIKVFGMEDLAKTAVELNKKSPLKRGKKQFFFNFCNMAQELSMELHYLEALNLPAKVVYTLSSHFDLITSQLTIINPELTHACAFLARVEAEMDQQRRLKRVNLYVQAGNEEAAQLVCDDEIMVQAMFKIIRLFKLPSEPATPSPDI